MFFIPFNTDAPIYHFPWMTIVLIVANLAAFVATGFGSPEGVVGYQLSFGNGLSPIEWLGWNFIHYGFLHLIGNMLFLWGFGIVVEGKLGWWRYLLLYLGIGVAEGALVQAMMLGFEPSAEMLQAMSEAGGEPGAGGASGVIFGLMAIALIWAPKNELSVLIIFFYRTFLVDVSILTFCGLFLTLELIFFAIDGFSMGSALLHFWGATLGAAAGVALLKQGWVDCENWDLFAVLANRHGRREEHFETDYRRELTPISWSDAEHETDPRERRRKRASGKASARPDRKLQRYLADSNPIAALGEYERLRATRPGLKLGAEDLYRLATGLAKEEQWADAEHFLVEYLKRFASTDAAKTLNVRLRLAVVLVDQTGRPQIARKVLKPIRRDDLSVKQQETFDRLRVRIRDALEQKSDPTESPF